MAGKKSFLEQKFLGIEIKFLLIALVGVIALIYWRTAKITDFQKWGQSSGTGFGSGQAAQYWFEAFQGKRPLNAPDRNESVYKQIAAWKAYKKANYLL